jgi:hypothetical protein
MKLGILLFLAACGSSTNPGGDGGGGGNDLAMSGGGGDLAGLDLACTGLDLAIGAYPPAPYGNTVGSNFPPLVWEGYVATDGSFVVNSMPTVVPFGPYSADDAHHSSKRYAMVHVSEFF